MARKERLSLLSPSLSLKDRKWLLLSTEAWTGRSELLISLNLSQLNRLSPTLPSLNLQTLARHLLLPPVSQQVPNKALCQGSYSYETTNDSTKVYKEAEKFFFFFSVDYC